MQLRNSKQELLKTLCCALFGSVVLNVASMYNVLRKYNNSTNFLVHYAGNFQLENNDYIEKTLLRRINSPTSMSR